MESGGTIMSETTLKAETKDMGRVTVAARIVNVDDLWRAERGEIPEDQVRQLEIEDALIDTGCTGLGLRQSAIEDLGLKLVRHRRVRTAGGPREVAIHQVAKLEVQGRDCVVEVSSLPEDSPMLIGQVPLEIMDFVVDPQGQRLIGNPAHGGEWVNEMY
jgi:predicted aspartyl protease